MAYDEPGQVPATEPPGVPAMSPGTVDDPAQGGPGRDRIGVHLVWEALLLAGLATLVVLLAQADADALRGDRLRTLLVDAVALGLLALAAGLSLRTAAVNLAVGPVAVAAALHFAEQGDRGLRESLVPALVVAALGGLALALAVVVLHVPGWAASLAAAAAVVVWIERRIAPVTVQGDHDVRRVAFHLFAGFAAVAVLGGLFTTIRAVRRTVGRFRPVADPARRRGVLAALVTVTALVGSTLLALLAGVLVAASGTAPVVPEAGLDGTVLAVGVALLGGTSAYGRRGGILGTLLAVSVVVVALALAAAEGRPLDRWAVGAAALAVGLVVTRLVETFGRPRPAAGQAAELAPVADGTISSGWSLARPGRTDSWTPALPTPTTDAPRDPWDSPHWETGPSRWDDRDR
ncbi:ABC transporter permease [Micromonospora sp. KC606]|uniref:ABC transporter permease n=1 Tax=Micromonospora sp. KC606 TaxID=2530379 RepID=UPI00104A765B|nr:ABC transporter permease [Micromonospora sp. KC606]TDC82332.1 ABC transporter permease [Micromonospora sp. KC606]